MTVALYIDEIYSPYLSMPVDCWGITRNAKLYQGDGPIIAHPPCGPWGRLYRLCKHQDASCGPRAVEQIRAASRGVLEHPTGSKLWKACNLPPPSIGSMFWKEHGFTIQVDQSSFGHCCKKSTWLWFWGIAPHTLPPTPPPKRPTAVISTSSSALRYATKKEARMTPPNFATWLVSAVSL